MPDDQPVWVLLTMHERNPEIVQVVLDLDTAVQMTLDHLRTYEELTIAAEQVLAATEEGTREHWFVDEEGHGIVIVPTTPIGLPATSGDRP